MTTPDSTGHYLIKGFTHDRKVFRPGDWAERLMGVITPFVGEHRPGIHIAATRLAMPVVDAGVKCLIVSAELQDVANMVSTFARRQNARDTVVGRIACEKVDVRHGSSAHVRRIIPSIRRVLRTVASID